MTETGTLPMPAPAQPAALLRRGWMGASAVNRGERSPTRRSARPSVAADQVRSRSYLDVLRLACPWP